jgi:hypothetical protein
MLETDAIISQWISLLKADVDFESESKTIEDCEMKQASEDDPDA